ncbi:hypothetical protein [Streptomyces sp. NPDC053048]|uniref:hypothetical protein n=1 Tax=Streptomyces sp. NPDC053048 TaxID=3365694 RepID=UPI0037D8EC4B
MLHRIRKAAPLAVAVVMSATFAGGLGGGTAAAAAGGGCGNSAPAQTNGSLVNDTVQQGNATVGNGADLVNCRVADVNAALSGPNGSEG